MLCMWLKIRKETQKKNKNQFSSFIFLHRFEYLIMFFLLRFHLTFIVYHNVFSIHWPRDVGRHLTMFVVKVNSLVVNLDQIALLFQGHVIIFLLIYN